MNNAPIVQALINYLEKEPMPFSMPGNKGGRGFSEEIKYILTHGDITEVNGMDNLHKPEGVIEEAQKLLSRYYGSLASYFLVNGSTSGNLTMIFSAFKEGDEIIVERNCHKSIFNGIILRKLKPIYIENEYSQHLGIPLGVSLKKLQKLLDSHKLVKGVVITYPNYYGICSNLKGIIELCRERGVFTLIDSAHGAHLRACSELPACPVTLGADLVVMSAHKTLPTLTQGAYLHVNNIKLKEAVERYLYMFTTTSPSYLIMATLDYGRYYLEYKGSTAFKGLIEDLKSFREKVKKLDLYNCIDTDYLKALGLEEFSVDESRIVINIKETEGSGSKLLEQLYLRGIQGELGEGRNIVLLPSPFNNREEYQGIYSALKALALEDIKEEKKIFINHSIPKRILLPHEVVEREGCEIKYTHSEGRIAAENIIPYPPGIPIIMMGEEISSEIIENISYYKSIDTTVLGLSGDKIKVL